MIDEVGEGLDEMDEDDDDDDDEGVDVDEAGCDGEPGVFEDGVVVAVPVPLLVPVPAAAANFSRSTVR